MASSGSLSGNQIIFLGPTLAHLDFDIHANPIRCTEARADAADGSAGKAAKSVQPLKRKRTVGDLGHLPRQRGDPAAVTGLGARGSETIQRQRGNVHFALEDGADESELGSTHAQDNSPASEVEAESGSYGEEGSESVGNSSETVPSYELEAESEVSMEKSDPSVDKSPVSKSSWLKLGPARAVGMPRIAAGKPPLLRALERPRGGGEEAKGSARGAKDSQSADSPSRLAVTEERSIGEISRAVTTVESIPPPPTHAFSLAHVTPISILLSTPNRYLSSYQGGNHFEGTLKFNLLALVTRVMGLEEVRDWKAGGGRQMDRCDVVVKDASGCALKVVLEADCATLWAAPREQGLDRHSSSDSLADQTGTSNTSSEWCSDLLEPSLSAAQDSSTSASLTTIERQKDQRLLPIRPGDVVVLSRLHLVRPRLQQILSSSSPSARLGSKVPTNTHAVASPSSGSQLELCWRNCIQQPCDQRRNFDRCLTAFDARCRAIYRLAQAWSSAE